MSDVIEGRNVVIGFDFGEEAPGVVTIWELDEDGKPRMIGWKGTFEITARATIQGLDDQKAETQTQREIEVSL